jgi:dihydrofolate reductase
MRLVAVESVTLDGVMQAPGRSDEDTRDGFAHGGWAVPYGDEVLAREMGARMGREGALLLGRRTYEDLYGYWPNQPPNPYTEALDRARKHVASTTLSEPLPWANSTLLRGDVADAVAALKASEPGGHLTVIGSGALVRSLAARGLVDAYLLLIHPLVLGTGRRLFDGAPATPLRLTGTVTTTKGVIIADYEPDPEG